ncbi:hypothetical protein [Chryseobacterium piperi]|uniref:hypothetical protein n=1 Tax=Chryseobacterium piperi TaxID=558152 RepID=UPI0012FDC711|nr:hypothetical protein [Chryseobacterium piperi]
MRPALNEAGNPKLVGKGCGFVDKARAKNNIDFTHKSTSTTTATILVKISLLI